MAKEVTKRSENYSQWYNDLVEEEGKCVYSGKPSHQRVIFARSY